MRETTHRQYQVWQARLAEPHHRPATAYHQLTRIAAEGRRGWVKDPNRVIEDDLAVKYGKRAKASTPEDAAEMERRTVEWVVAMQFGDVKVQGYEP